MKILVAHCVKRSRTGGMSRIMGFLHDEIAKEGHEVEYFCQEDAAWASGFGPGLSRFTFPVAVLALAARRARQGRAYDIINVHEPSGAALCLARRWLGGAKLAVTSHGLEQRGWRLRLDGPSPERPSGKSRLLYPLTLLWQAALSLRLSDHVFCLNFADRDYLLAHFGRQARDVTRVYPAADPAFGRKAAFRDYGRCETVLFAGSWLIRKGILDLIEAFTRLAARHPSLRLAVLNPGTTDEAVAGAFPAEVRPRVRCLRTRTEEETIGVFEAADLFLLPSLFEGTPLTLIEAMWSGLPILSTAVCGMKDVLDDRRNGWLVPAQDPAALTAGVEALLADRPLREALGRAAQQDARERYRWDLVAQPLLASYEALANLPARTRRTPASLRDVPARDRA